MNEVALFCGEPTAPAATPRFALGQRGNARGQTRHHHMPGVRGHFNPIGNLGTRATTTDAKSGFRLHHAYFDARCFNSIEVETVHRPSLK